MQVEALAKSATTKLREQEDHIRNAYEGRIAEQHSQIVYL
jgi:hypothetical protein